MTTTQALAPAEYGEIFTKRWVVDLILDLAGYTTNKDLPRLTIVEPSVGSGAFVVPIIERLLAAWARSQAKSWTDLRPSVRGYDLQPHHVQTCRDLAIDSLIQAGCPQGTATELAQDWFSVGDFLLLRKDDLRADYVVGNPPYIRIEDLEPNLLRAYREACPTMGGRADIFVGFYEHGLDLLADRGRLAFICADRWMRNAYGRALRRKVIDGPFAMRDILVMHDAPAFESEVSAYPAITVLGRERQGEVVNGVAHADFGPRQAAEYSAWALEREGAKSCSAYSGAVLADWHTTADSWPDGGPDLLAWLNDLAARFPVIEDPETGTKLGIGIATGADAVYVTSAETPDIEEDRLLPLAMAQDIKSGQFQWRGSHLVNPWDRDGLVDLADYPRFEKYLLGAIDTLTSRNVAKRNPTRWHRTIDRVNVGLLARPMLVMEDMKSRAHPVLIPPGFYPHHNLYWIISDAWDLRVLGGLLMSAVVERQVGAYCVKMRGGTLRFQAQYLRRVRLPRPSEIPPEIQRHLARAFEDRDRDAATRAAMAAYGIDQLP